MGKISFGDLTKDFQDALISVFGERLSTIEDLQKRNRIDHDVYTADAVWDNLERQKKSILKAVKEHGHE